LDAIDACSSGVDPEAPLVLIGGGAQGRTWRSVAQRLSGRAISIPDATELVAIGAAVQAAAIMGGETPQAVAARWRTDRGVRLDPKPRDAGTIACFRTVRRLASGAVSVPRAGR
jgi:xylulokinase